MRYCYCVSSAMTVCQNQMLIIRYFLSWLVVGVAGATCSGKTTLAKALSAAFPNAKYLSQDDFYLPEGDERHVYVKELEHINWELVTAYDMEAMHKSIGEITGQALKKEEAAESGQDEREALAAKVAQAVSMDDLKTVTLQCKVTSHSNLPLNVCL